MQTSSFAYIEKSDYIPESIDADSSSSCNLGKRAKQAARARMTVSCDLGKASEAQLGLWLWLGLRIGTGAVHIQQPAKTFGYITLLKNTCIWQYILLAIIVVTNNCPDFHKIFIMSHNNRHMLYYSSYTPIHKVHLWETSYNYGLWAPIMIMLTKTWNLQVHNTEMNTKMFLTYMLRMLQIEIARR